MKNYITTGLGQLVKHQRLMWLLVVLVIVALGTILYISVTIEASELRIITHYTAYGITHFYRDQWIYLISFALFAGLVALFGIAVSLKLLYQDREPLALLCGWISIASIAMALVTYIRLVGFI